MADNVVRIFDYERPARKPAPTEDAVVIELPMRRLRILDDRPLITFNGSDR